MRLGELSPRRLRTRAPPPTGRAFCLRRQSSGLGRQDDRNARNASAKLEVDEAPAPTVASADGGTRRCFRWRRASGGGGVNRRSDRQRGPRWRSLPQSSRAASATLTSPTSPLPSRGPGGHENKCSRTEPRPRTLGSGRPRSSAPAPTGPDRRDAVVGKALPVRGPRQAKERS
jgi:hypothetical protein